MSPDLELYYFPLSYDSLKALLALHEKNLTFKKHYVYTPLGEQYENWYLRLNPHGEIPILRDGSDVICESEEIIDYIDKKSEDGPCLVPDVTTPLGRRVSEIRKWLCGIPMEAITYGLMLHPSLQVDPLDLIQMFRKNLSRETYESAMKADIARFRKRQKADPSLHDALEKKIAAYQWTLDTVLDEHRMREILSGLQQTFDQIERELESSRTYTGTDAVWICGITFTAADISMAVLFNHLERLHLAGGEYYSASTRPLVRAYRDRLYRRPAVRNIIWEYSQMRRRVKLRMKVKEIRNVATKAFKVVLVVGILAVVVYGVREYTSRK